MVHRWVSFIGRGVWIGGLTAEMEVLAGWAWVLAGGLGVGGCRPRCADAAGGGRDAYAAAAMLLDDCRGVTVIDGAGHWVQLETPDAVNRALLDFLDSL